jgi:hypothetical protein
VSAWPIVRIATVSEELEEGHCGGLANANAEDRYEPRVDLRTRLDPLDPSTFRHLGGCEHRDVTDVVAIKAILTVHEREDYWYVQCSTCEGGWQVPYHAAEVG